MTRSKYLRDARHVDKFMYTLSHALFYEPLDICYRPLEEYRDLVKGLITEHANGWKIMRDGFWFFTHPGEQFSLPIQGWKIHVSAAMENSASVLSRAARIALSNRVPFKFALDKNVLAMMSSKRWPRGGSGKFITMYPSDLDCFKSLLEQLHAELQSEDGPYILSDRRYKDCRVLYYRYGGIERTSRLDIKGEKVLVLIAPDGEAVPDIRTPYFAPPPWATDPFPSEKSERRETALKGRYLVKQALSFSNSGGVYLAEDRDSGAKVVIKEARAHTAMDDQGNDAIKFLKKEHEMLELLRNTGIAPNPVDAFQIWENFFLVEEYVDGVDIRKIMLNESPLMRSRPSLEDTRHYYEACKAIFKSFANTVHVLHKRGIVFGDLNAKNIKIDPTSYGVKLIDFEGAFRPGVDTPTYLFTPGFKSEASILKNAQGFEDDLYAVAANMLYMLFPIAAFASLRDDLFDTVLKTMLANIGWAETPVLKAIHGLAKNEITCARACELLDEPARIAPPSYADDVEPRDCDPIVQELGRFIVANIRTESKDSLFPADPFLHRTNPLSLGFGACGVLYALKKCNCEIPQAAWEWLERKLERVKAEELAPGLLTGAAGIAWSLEEMGWGKRAAGFLKMANESPLLRGHPSYLYGMAGVGMANLHFYLRSRRPEYLAIANELGDELLRRAQESERGIYWEHEKVIHVGYGYGQSGVALFFLRLYQVTGREKFLAEGRRALEFDLSHGLSIEPGIISFPRAPGDPTLLPYLEEGSAGIAKVAIRYGMWNQLEAIWADVHRKYSGFVGLLYGLGSFVDVLTDAFLLSNDVRFLEMAKRPVTGIRDIYLLKRPEGLATPGDNLFRISCDYTTGIAGVMRALHRFAHHDEADFVLDEASAATEEGEAAQTMQVAAMS
jgi:tRNA A-37 threonylcarbamoyl transferase component Bud32